MCIKNRTWETVALPLPVTISPCLIRRQPHEIASMIQHRNPAEKPPCPPPTLAPSSPLRRRLTINYQLSTINYSMPAATSSTASTTEAPPSGPVRPARITSIDALRGMVMFTMIYVNDLAGVPGTIVPAWMKHFHGKSGMTFVDLVFPAFLFIVGMSIPFGLGSRLSKGEPLWKIILYLAVRTLSLLFIGILMVNETPSSEKMGWSGALWATLMYFSAILAFCTISPPQEPATAASRKRTFHMVSLAFRLLGLAMLVYLAFAFRGEDGHRIISLTPFSIHTEWYGILGLIGWAYLVGAMVFLVFRGHR